MLVERVVGGENRALQESRKKVKSHLSGSPRWTGWLNDSDFSRAFSLRAEAWCLSANPGRAL